MSHLPYTTVGCAAPVRDDDGVNEPQVNALFDSESLNRCFASSFQIPSNNVQPSKLEKLSREITLLKADIKHYQNIEKLWIERRKIIYKEFVESRLCTPNLPIHCKYMIHDDEKGITAICGNAKCTQRSVFDPKKNKVFVTSKTIPRWIECPTCKETFYTAKKKKPEEKEGFFQHIKTCQPQNVKLLNKMLKEQKLKPEKSLFTIKSRKTSRCEQCNVKFNRSIDKDFHKCNVKLVCDKCDHVFDVITNLQNHFKRSKCF